MQGHDSVSFQFDPPRDGWGRLRVQIGARQVDLTFSYAPQDTILQLAETADAICSGLTERTVVFHEEPHETELVFRLRPGASALTMSFVRFRDHRRNVDGEPLLDAELSPATAATLLWRALRQLESREEYEREWKHPFPSRIVAQVTSRLKGAAVRMGEAAEQPVAADEAGAVADAWRRLRS